MTAQGASPAAKAAFDAALGEGLSATREGSWREKELAHARAMLMAGHARGAAGVAMEAVKGSSRPAYRRIRAAASGLLRWS